MTEWLEAQRGSMEAQIKEIDSLRASSKSLLRETNELRFLQVDVLYKHRRINEQAYWACAGSQLIRGSLGQTQHFLLRCHKGGRSQKTSN